MNENNKFNQSFKYIYMLVVTAIVCLLPLLYDQVPVPARLTVFVLTLTVIIVLWKKSMSKKLLYMLDLLNIILVSSVASLAILLLDQTIASIVSFVIVVIFFDVISFTRRGKHTLNAKLMSQTTTLARLSICLPIPGKPGLQPIIGIGDLYFYSLMTFYAIHVYGVFSCYIVLFILMVGQFTNIWIISLIIHKQWYHGFPATLFPGLFYMISLIIGLIE